MSLTFLRPMGLPRPATLHRFLTTAANPSKAAAAVPTPAAPKHKPYLVTRSATNNLPIYLLWKRGGNLKQTRIRRIEGDIASLRTDLQKALKIADEKDVMINQLTKHIIVRGHWKAEVEKFLLGCKF